ncbi:MAG: C2 domain-containing protein [Myxococcota bacterium]
MIKTPLLLILALLIVWLLIRAARNKNVPAWARAVQALLVVAGVLVGLYYCAFRIKRAKADVQRSRATAKMLVDTLGQYQSDRDILSALATPLGVGYVVDTAEVIVDLASRGEISTLKKAGNDARYCLAEVNRDLGLIDLLAFSQPAPCRLMFRTLGEPGELADAGVTFEDAATRVTTKASPGTPGGPACREWTIDTIQVTLPKTKKSGKPWDVGDVSPDPYVSFRIGSGKRIKSPRAENRHDLTWKPKKPVVASPGSTLEVQVYDADLIDDDFAFGWEAKVPTHLASSWKVGSRPNVVELSLSCRR